MHVSSTGKKPYTTGFICPFFKDLKCYGLEDFGLDLAEVPGSESC